MLTEATTDGAMLPVLKKAAQRAGGVTALAKSLGLSRAAIYRWRKRIPAERLVDIEAATGITRKELRPDLYGAPKRKRR